MHPYLYSLFGGCLLGMSCVLYLYATGKIAGISGLISQITYPNSWFKHTAFYFILGLLLSAAVVHYFWPIKVQVDTPIGWLLLSGFLVGLGTRIGSGCTSGHGICGLSRLSKRSLIAVLCFISSAWLTVQLMQWLQH